MKSSLTFIKLCTLLLLLTLLIWGKAGAQTAEDSPLGIEYPLPGQAVQGLIQIEGFINLENFDSYKLAFSFEDQNAWFPIISKGEEIVRGQLGEWDTSAITDGNYDLLLTIITVEGESLELIVKGIRVRNYSTIETDTPQPTFEQQEIIVEPTVSATLTTAPKPGTTTTPIPPNQAAFSNSDIQNTLINGGVLGIILFGLLTLIFQKKKSR